jgi:glycine cleavage system H protein
MKFTDSHEWIRIDGNIGIVGITEHARKELGEVVFIELPKIGNYLAKTKEAAVLESTKAAADIYCPMSGKVIEVNDALKAINHSPESEGWLFKIEIENPSELNTLMDREEYCELIKGS